MTTAADPFTEHLVLDLVRVAIIPAALLLCALVVRLTLHRHHRKFSDPARYVEQTHPASMWSYAICLLFIAIRRADQLGEPFTWYMVPSCVVVALGYYGVLRRVDLRLPRLKR